MKYTAALLLASALESHAAGTSLQFIYEFSGMVTDVSDSSGLVTGLPSNSIPFSGLFSIDLTAVDTFPSAEVGIYDMLAPPASLTLNVADNIFVAQSEVQAEILNTPGQDRFSLSSGAFSIGSFELIQGSLVFPPGFELTMFFSLEDFTGTALSSDLLSQPINFDDFADRRFDLESSNEQFQIEGDITNITIIPETGTGFLCLLGGSLLVAQRKNRPGLARK